MNAASLQHLWTYLQGLTLTPRNKQWLADHLYEDIKTELQNKENKNRQANISEIRKQRETELWADIPKLSAEDIAPTQDILDIVKDIEPLPEDVDIDKLKQDYLIQKHG
ncbi:MAG: hypothetical protein IJ607_03090 [Bacteroidaceae bacterium]|nr:hypothetical protein [Bacteroidaceae bacterium]